MASYSISFHGGAKMMSPVNNRQEYLALRGSSRQKLILDEVRNHGLTERKKQLLQMCYSCLPNEDGSLKGSTRVANSVGMDIDFDPQDPAYEQRMAEVPAKVLAHKDELGLLMLERSVKKGYHVVFRRRPELSQEENLFWASDLLGVAYDEAAKDITRVFFTTSSSYDDLLYLDDALFEQAEASVNAPAPVVSQDASAPVAPVVSQSSAPELLYQGIPYSRIIDKYWEMFNEGHTPSEGSRNALTFELAIHLRHICDYSLDRLLAVIPRYDDLPEAEWRQTIENALKEPRRGVSHRMRQVLASLKEARRMELTGGTSIAPPPMPKRLPPLIKLLVSKVPDVYKPAVANAVFPALGAHLHGVKFRYWDNVEHEPTFMHVLIGRQSVGKGCIKQPIKHILADILKRDEPNRQREAEWKRLNPSGKTKAKDPRPKDICIQVLGNNLTDAAFNQRLVDANQNGKRYLYMMVDELEGLKKVTTRGSIDEVTLLMRSAFDNELHGQERVGSDSVTGIAPLRWNWNASTTPPNARRFFAKAVNDGTLSRLDISTIIVDDDNDELPIMGTYDDRFAQELKPYIDRLEAANGLIECPQARKLSLKICEENKEMAALMESGACRVLSPRANVISYLKGMLLFVTNGYSWNKEIADFVRWSNRYNLWCKLLYFGPQLEAELEEEKQCLCQHGPQNMLEMLPDEFSRQEYVTLRQTLGKKGDGASTLRSWVGRGHICWDDYLNKYVKTKR